jgi:nitroreductase
MPLVDNQHLNPTLDLALTLISTRQTILPRHLVGPGPSPSQLDLLYQAAAAAPDHGCVCPWRFIEVPQNRREDLATAFAQSLCERDAQASAQQIEQARDKAFRSPFLALVVARLGLCEPPIDPLERLVAVGAAVQNLLLCAHAMGLASSLTGGQALRELPVRQLFGLQDQEEGVCFLNLGTASQRKPFGVRPVPTDFVRSL